MNPINILFHSSLQIVGMWLPFVTDPIHILPGVEENKYVDGDYDRRKFQAPKYCLMREKEVEKAFCCFGKSDDSSDVH